MSFSEVSRQMKKIVVVGCGHGGLTAAANFAKCGYDVTVLEKNRREELGYDWHDSVGKMTFETSGVPSPDESCYLPADRMCYYNPKKTVKVVPERAASKSYAYIDRKFLINYLIDYALECGVKIFFETEVVSSICSVFRVEGVKYIENGEEKKLFSDLVIDAGGVYSPARLSLPDRFGIKNRVDKEDIFIGWRGYFEKTDDTITDPESNIYFFHCNVPGMDWAITKDGYMDVLVGGFGELSDYDVETAIKDFRNDYPYMSDKLLRGGYSDVLPLGKALPVFVCSGYAAAGNSAYMTEPLSGSGVDLSMYAGKILSDIVIESGGDCSVENLWVYNYTYIKKQTEKRYMSSIIKSAMSVLDGGDIDFLMEQHIMTQKEIAGTGGELTFKQCLEKLNVVKRPSLFPMLISMLGKITLVSKLKKDIPEKYNKAAVKKWSEEYMKL